MREMIEDLWSEGCIGKFILALTAFCVVAIVLLVTVGIESLCFYNSFPGSGRVVGLQYTAARSSTGVGTVVGANGKVGTVITSDSTPESFEVFVDNGRDTVSCTTTARRYFQLHNGDAVSYHSFRGKITGIGIGRTLDSQ